MKTKKVLLKMIIVFICFTGSISAHQNQLSKTVYVSDIDHDGTDDYIKITNGNTIQVYKSDPYTAKITLKPLVLTKIKRLVIGDFMGKGNVIGVILENNEFQLYELDQDQKELSVLMTQANFVMDYEDVIIGDFDGDKRSEIMTHDNKRSKIKIFGIPDNRTYFDREPNSVYDFELFTRNLRNKRIYAGEFRNLRYEVNNTDLMVLDINTGTIDFYVTFTRDGESTFHPLFSIKNRVVNQNESVVVANISGSERDDLLIRDCEGNYRLFEIQNDNGSLNPIIDVINGQLRTEKGSAVLVAHKDVRKIRDNILFRQNNTVHMTGAGFDQNTRSKTYWWAYTNWWICENEPAQNSPILDRPVVNQEYFIKSAVGNKFMKLVGHNSGARETSLEIGEFTADFNQRFIFEDAGDGYFYIKSKYGRALHVYGANTDLRAKVNLWDVVDRPNLKWKLIPTCDGYHYIQSQLGTYLDVKLGNPANGTPIWMWSFNGGNAQKWKLIRENAPVTFERTIKPSFGGRCINAKDGEKRGSGWDFVHGVDVDFQLSIRIEGHRLMSRITLDLSRGRNIGIRQSWEKEIYNTGFGSIPIKSFDYLGRKYTSGERFHSRTLGTLPKSGTEVFPWPCGEGETHTKNFYGELKIIGDTGGNDISDDRDCGCDSKLVDFIFHEIKVELERNPS